MNDREQEIKSVANKLLQGGIAKSHMDAMKMAESMVQTDMTPSGRRIDNLAYADPEPVSNVAPANNSSSPDVQVSSETIEEPIKQPDYSMPPTYNVDGEYDDSTPISELTKDPLDSKSDSDSGILDEIKEEIDEVEHTPNSYTLDIPEIEDSTDETHLQDELSHIEQQEESPEEQKIEREESEELAEPELIRREQAISDSEESPEDIKEHIQEIESEPESDSQGEDEVEQELDEPELVKKEEQYRQEDEEELEMQSHSDIEVVDIDDDESDEITNLF